MRFDPPGLKSIHYQHHLSPQGQLQSALNHLVVLKVLLPRESMQHTCKQFKISFLHTIRPQLFYPFIQRMFFFFNQFLIRAKSVTAVRMNNAQNNLVHWVNKLSGTDCLDAAIVFCDMSCRYEENALDWIWCFDFGPFFNVFSVSGINKSLHTTPLRTPAPLPHPQAHLTHHTHNDEQGLVNSLS